MQINDVNNAWRNKWVQARFRSAIFYVETDARAGGRRVALHQYPKRNTPYAEDMGRTAVQITINGYVIGKPTTRLGQRNILSDPTGRAAVAPIRDYLTMKNALITALEADGPGELQLPMQYQFKNLDVMVMGYTVNESREKGGMCVFQMQFVEYGNPRYRVTISTPEEIMRTAVTVEKVLMGLVQGKSKEQVLAALQPYTSVFNNASPDIGDDRGLAGMAPSVPQSGGGFTTGGSF